MINLTLLVLTLTWISTVYLAYKDLQDQEVIKLTTRKQRLDYLRSINKVTDKVAEPYYEYFEEKGI